MKKRKQGHEIKKSSKTQRRRKKLTGVDCLLAEGDNGLRHLRNLLGELEGGRDEFSLGQDLADQTGLLRLSSLELVSGKTPKKKIIIKSKNLQNSKQNKRRLSYNSMALDLPIALTSLWVPPAPGIVPSLISGWPKTALSLA